MGNSAIIGARRMRLRWMAVAAALAMPMPLALAPHVGAVEPAQAGRIVFSFVDDGGARLRLATMAPDGSDRRILSAADDNAIWPRWSPDARRIAFLRGGDIFVMQSDGSQQLRLTSGRGVTHLSWSPDGKKIAFTSFGPGGHLWVTRADGTRPRALTPDPNLNAKVDWSPDGKTIVLSDTYAIYSIRPDGSKLRRLTRTTRATQPACRRTANASRSPATATTTASPSCT